MQSKPTNKMRKWMLFFFVGLFGCGQQTNNQPATVPTNAAKDEHYYKPGLGELMSVIQTHHAKLWFAGINENWKLSEYELGEMKEMFQTAKEVETDRTEINNIPMIYGELDSVSNAIRTQNLELFKSHFQSLTNTCNSCHQTVGFEFNVITIPTGPPVTNQDFKVKK
jgi:hypothetical protein